MFLFKSQDLMDLFKPWNCFGAIPGLFGALGTLEGFWTNLGLWNLFWLCKDNCGPSGATSPNASTIPRF